MIKEIIVVEGPKDISAVKKDIRRPLDRARTERLEGHRPVFTMADLLKTGLAGTGSAGVRRNMPGEVLGIGRCSARKMLQRLNGYQITREAFKKSLNTIEESG